MTNYFFRKNSIIKFYQTLDFNNFESITPERKIELDIIIEKWREIFIENSVGLTTLMTYTAEKLTTSHKKFKLCNGDEIAYFYIKIVDPNLLFLEAYESSNLKNEIKNLCMKNFFIYDIYLINLERIYNNYFKEYNHEELWSRSLIKKDL